MRAVINIPIEKLKQHPRNVRKEIGDISELVKSIQEQGIFQNLTVVKDPEEDAYLVVIGNRRLAASKEAGISHLPCIVVEMDEKEQQATMLLENIQRTDLTIQEQAQGFQTCLDLGMSLKELETKTGFSQKTIKHRLELNKLGDGLKETQLPLTSLYELEKVDDEVKKKEIFNAAKSPDRVTYLVNNYLSEKLSKTNKDCIKRICEKLGIKHVKEWWELKEIFCFKDCQSKKITESFIEQEIQKLQNDPQFSKKNLYFNLEYVPKILIKTDPVPQEETEWQKERRMREERKKKLDIAFKKMKDGRSILMEMFKNGTLIIPDKKVESIKESLWFLVAAETYGEEGSTYAFEEIKKLPLLSLLILRIEEKLPENCYNYNAEFSKSAAESFVHFYNILSSAINFPPSEEERMLMDGTHPDYKDKENKHE